MDLIFSFLISFVFLIIFFLIYKDIKNILAFSFFLKWSVFCFITYNNIVFNEGDQYILFWNSLYKSNLNILNLFSGSEIFTSGFYTTTLAFLYKILSNNSFNIAISLNITLSLIATIYLFKLVRNLATLQTSKIICFIFAVYPFFIYYNLLFLRDTIIASLFIISSYYFLIGLKNNNNIYKLYFLFFVFLSSFYHIANFILLLTGLSIFIFLFIDNLVYRYFKSNIRYIIYVSLPIVILYLFFINIYEILTYFQITKLPKLGDINFPTDGSANLNNLFFEILISKMNIYKLSSASQPLFLNINSFTDLMYKPFIKFFYFIYAPFVWEISSLKHFAGFIDSLFIFVLSIIIIYFRKYIFIKKDIILLILLLFPTLFLYTLFGSNFGTNLRHKIKFIFLILLISSIGLDHIFLYLKERFRFKISKIM